MKPLELLLGEAQSEIESERKTIIGLPRTLFVEWKLTWENDKDLLLDLAEKLKL